MLHAGGAPHPVGVDDHVVAQVDGDVRDGAARRVEDEVAALALGEGHVLEARVCVELLRRAVGGPRVLDDVDGLGIQARGVEGLEDQARAVESLVVGACTSPRVRRARLVPRVPDHGLDALGARGRQGQGRGLVLVDGPGVAGVHGVPGGLVDDAGNGQACALLEVFDGGDEGRVDGGEFISVPQAEAYLDDAYLGAVHAPGERVGRVPEARDVVGGLQVAGRGLVSAPRSRGVELVAAAVQFQGRGAHDAGVGVEVVPLSPVAQPASHLGAVGREVVPAVGQALPAGAHRTRGPQVVPRAVHGRDPRAHHARIGVEVVPLAPVAQPTANLRTVGGEEVPPVEEVLPAGAHRARGSQVVPRAIHGREPRAHHAAGGIEVVPRSAVAQPTANECPGGSQEEPIGTVTKPAGGHVATVVEVVAATPDPHPLVSRVRSIGTPPPPADRVTHPGTPSGLVLRAHRRGFVTLRRGRGRPVLVARAGGGGLGRVRGLGARGSRRRGR